MESSQTTDKLVFIKLEPSLRGQRTRTKDNITSNIDENLGLSIWLKRQCIGSNITLLTGIIRVHNRYICIHSVFLLIPNAVDTEEGKTSEHMSTTDYTNKLFFWIFFHRFTCDLEIVYCKVVPM